MLAPQTAASSLQAGVNACVSYVRAALSGTRVQSSVRTKVPLWYRPIHYRDWHCIRGPIRNSIVAVVDPGKKKKKESSPPAFRPLGECPLQRGTTADHGPPHLPNLGGERVHEVVYLHALKHHLISAKYTTEWFGSSPMLTQCRLIHRRTNLRTETSSAS